MNAAEYAQRKLIMLSGEKGDIVQLQMNSKIGHINSRMMNQTYSKDEIVKLRRQKLAEIKMDKNPSLDPTKTNPSLNGFSTNPPKKKRKKQRKKELYNINNKFNNPIIQNTSYSSFQESLNKSDGSDKLGENIRPLLNKRKSNTLSPEERRNLLRDGIKYSTKSNTPLKEVSVTRNTQIIFNLWDELAHEIQCVLPINKTKRLNKQTKKFIQTCKLCSAFFNGTLPKNKIVSLSKYNKLDLMEHIKKTPKDFKQHLDWFKLRLLDSSYKQLEFKNVDLHFFLAGNDYMNIPSLLLTWCWTKPKRLVTFDYEEYFPVLVDSWEQAGGCNTFTTKDLQNFDDYFCWALPHFKQLRNNFNSLNSFDDELDVLEFFTFGVLRKFKDRGKNFSTNILNQEFFKNMMEDLRKHHGYTV